VNAKASERAQDELARRAQREIVRRRNTPEYKAAVARQIVAELHPKQLEVLDGLQSGARFAALTCSRRAGKTHLLASIIVLRLLTAGFNQEVVFAAPTLARGKELIWLEVCRLIDRYHLGWQRWDNVAKIRTAEGAIFRITGLDTKRAIGKNRGGDTVAFLCDEAQEFPHLLEQLLVAVGPALTQRRGWFVASGTPGPAKRGYWFAIAHGAEGFQPYHWDLTQNTKLGRPGGEIIAEEMARCGWGPNHPTLMRELRGLWVEDHTLLVCELDQVKNITNDVPDYSPSWRHFLGVDYGFSPDPCAWVVAAAHPHRNFVAIVHAEKAHRLTSDQIAAKTKELVDRFGCKAVVGDSASGGATFINDFNERYGRAAGVTMRAAEKADKAGSVEMLNTELRTGRLVLLPSATPLAEEMRTLQYKTVERLEMMPGAEDHCFDAFRYCLRALRAHTAKPAALPKTEDQLRVERRNRQEAARQRAQFAGY